MRYLLRAGIVLAACCIFAAPILADTVYLKNGRKMHGKVTFKGKKIIIETKLGRMSFSRREVERVERDDKTLKVPGEEKQLPKKGDTKAAWKILPDMPYHLVPYAQIKVGDKLVAYDPRNGTAIFGNVKTIKTQEEERTTTFEEPSKAFFQGSDSDIFSFYKVDTDATLAKLLLFGCKKGDEITLFIQGTEKRDVVFVELSEKGVVFKEKAKAPETLAINKIYSVENHSLRARAVESYLKSPLLQAGQPGEFYIKTVELSILPLEQR